MPDTLGRVLPFRGTAASFTSHNPVLGQGEVAYETDTGLTKIGDGSTAWTALPYAPAVIDGGSP